MLSAIRTAPAAASRAIASAVRSGVTLGATATRRPLLAARATISKMSSRFSGSPPVKTRTPGASSATCSIRSNASAPVSSRGLRSTTAQARQWRQARSQARVTSQIATTGERSMSIAVMPPAPRRASAGEAERSIRGTSRAIARAASGRLRGGSARPARAAQLALRRTRRDVRRIGSERREQNVLLGLLGSGLGDLVDDLQVARDEVRLEPRAARREHGVGVDARSRSGDDRRDHVLLAGGARGGRHAVHEDVGDVGVLGDHLLDEAGVDEVAVVADAATLPVVEEQPTLGVAVAHVAAPEPAALGLRARRRGIPEVLDRRRLAARRAAHDLAHHAGRALDARLVDDLHLETRSRAPEAPDRTL